MTRIRLFPLVAFAVLASAAPPPATAQTPPRPSDPRVKEFAAYADQAVRQLDSLRKRSVTIETGTRRGGVITGYYNGTAFMALSMTIRMANRDDMTRYLFRGGRTVVIDIVDIPLDPKRRTPRIGDRRLKARYLLISVGTRYVIHSPTERFQPITEQERHLLDNIMANLPRYRALLAGRRYPAR
ncbi:MAG: hypothetical protein SFU56_16240 [Capsulimonadales bacterium]|nr:hypothetical protein [Capsulimonadales bacterium]